MQGPSQWRRAGLRRQRPYDSGTATRNPVLGASPPGVGPARKVDSEGLHWDCLASSRPTASSEAAQRYVCAGMPRGLPGPPLAPLLPTRDPASAAAAGVCVLSAPCPGLQTAAGTQEQKRECFAKVIPLPLEDWAPPAPADSGQLLALVSSSQPALPASFDCCLLSQLPASFRPNSFWEDCN